MRGQVNEIVTAEAAMAAALCVLAARGRAIREERQKIMSSSDDASHSTSEGAKEIVLSQIETASIANQ